MFSELRYKKIMRLNEIYKEKQYELQANSFLTQKPIISFEIFPPKGEGEELKSKNEALLNELKILSKYNPAYVSVTYGAGGTTQDKTLDLVLKIKNELKLNPMPHFTCVGSNREEILDYIKVFEKNDIKNILALRGDPPKGEKTFIKPKNGFGHANELVEFVKSNTNLSIAVAGYPECHQECVSLDVDVENLKKKTDAGADAVITQVFYDNSSFFNFMIKTEQAGIETPIIPGILPITNYSQIQRMTELCGSKIPAALSDRLEKHKNDPDAVKEMGIEFAVYQCQQLLDFGVKGFHFYTLNKAYAASEILESISVELSV